MANGWEVRIPYIVEVEGDDGRDWERRSLARLDCWRGSKVLPGRGLLPGGQSVFSYLNRY
jgi:hypothetical protein